MASPRYGCSLYSASTTLPRGPEPDGLASPADAPGGAVSPENFV
jgi:hypothetical protein